MKRIQEIIDLAVSSPESLPTAMLHCKVLADGLGHEPFKDWVTKETNGYGDTREVPDYRRIRGRLGGYYERYFVDTTYDHVPVQTLGADLHAILETVRFTQGVGALAAYPDDGTTAFPIPMEKEVLSIINSKFGTHGRFVTLMVKCPPGSLRPVIVAIQHKLVSFLSEMNQLFPNESDYESPTAAEIASLDRSFGRHFNVEHADNIIISPGYVHVDQSSHVFQQINVGDWGQLAEFLGRQNVSPEKREEAKTILDRIEQGDDSEEVQEELKGWIEEAADDMTGTVGEVLKDATKKAATDTLVDALKKYAPAVAKWGWVVAMGL